MFLNSLHCNIASCCELAAQFEAKDTKKDFTFKASTKGLKNFLQDQSQEKRLRLQRQGQDQGNISQG